MGIPCTASDSEADADVVPDVGPVVVENTASARSRAERARGGAARAGAGAVGEALDLVAG